MFNVCHHCGLYCADKIIDPSGPYAIRPECGHRHRFQRLPLLLVAGVIPALGGTERQVGVAEMPLPDDLYHTGLAWSPDSRGLIVADVPEGEPPGLFLIPLDGGAKSRLTSAPGPWATGTLRSPVTGGG